jgi:putative heme-binding domain-containing protein
LLHVSPHAHFLWPRGWMLEKQPDRLDILDTIFPGMKRAVPVHMEVYDEPFLPEEYRNNLLVARWGIRTVTRYALRREGATIKSDEEKTLLAGRDLARPLGVCVGPQGRVFVTICYMAHNDGSPVYRSDVVMVTRADARAGADNKLYDAPAATEDLLWSELSTDSWGRRHRAHTEIQRRGGALLDEALERLAKTDPKDSAFVQLLWLAASSGTRRATEALKNLATHSEPDVRTQSIRALSNFDGPRGVFKRALSDSEPRVQHAATVAFYNLDGPVPEELVTRSAVSDESHIRQAATMLLAKRSSVSEFQRLCSSEDRAIRMAGVLAAGFRLTMPPVHEPLDSALPLDAYSGEEPYVIGYADATIDLRDFGPAGMFRVADHWKMREHEKWEEALFALLLHMLEDPDELIRLHVANFLAALRDPRSDSAVEAVRKTFQETRLADAPIVSVDSVWLAGPFVDHGKGFQHVHAPEVGPVDLGSTYEDGGRTVSWKRMNRTALFDFVQEIGPVNDASVYGFFRIETSRRQRALLLVGSDDGFKLWHNGEPVHEVLVARGALPFQDVVSLELQAGSNDMLVRVQNNSGGFGMYLHYRALDKIVVTLPEKVSLAALAERLSSGADGEVTVDPKFFETDWNVAVKAGKKEEGRKLFESLACNRCHAVRADSATTGGPSLADAKKRFTVPYLVESVLFPNKTISPVFRGTLIVTAAGDAHAGLVLGETAEEVDFLFCDGMRRKIPTNTILERKVLDSSPMPQGLVKSPEELANLLAFILSE